MTTTFLKMVEEDNYHWKWVLVALHNSLQGFMVCALRGRDGLNILKDNLVKKWVEESKNKEGNPSTKFELDTFLNLYKKIKTNRMLINKKSKIYSPRGQQDRSVRKLNQLRNNFIHFKQKSWYVEINSLPSLIRETIDIIKFLVFTSGNINAKKEEKVEIQKDIEEIKDTLDRLKAVLGN